ncbi:2-dehydro-3-deoxyphosphooctonate aldolase (KDO 8-P synthase) [Cytobacillus horneckiae]|uniref:2-dehydro-3-deoxyphosphooctonate aldolase n=1 Tax=Cytobacillus horneckiae TaxID=549687 RepID=A0A2N0ZFE4_9BACI|nr:3-deoxy-8-phosphooctulonate synthase [Cytobacillus horneckiae]NRG47819.1 3-deoxy-8-phosphooctulonate synthase [Bacillus sp. CRN 9]MBN6885233.1 3-deoxy-8-phosphooctulonate synthase [Cytobacillus horneckiae]MCM3179022.1 3-deoxy-8-phosphooctulonate synthase [Cytobacillus horneckiae]MEC1154239.1 3-deoxy-8-phosphooctulonate synthase [Cytobacillus horneckiae]MED2937575.1 3-deoxy-8-phosphooctulonate synthase [Cytobacillus horneckiae]
MSNSVILNEKIVFGENRPFVLIAGPCMLEDETIVMETAARLKEVTTKLNIPFVFKGSFDKANRSSIHSQRGPGLVSGINLLAKVKESFHVPVLSDIHESSQAPIAGQVLDIIQIPAFLCRQTDLLVAAAKTGKVINVKKGQFLAPNDMSNVVTKIREAGNERILLTERGSTFGYNNLVVDMRSLAIMKEFAPVVFDATHSVQIPGGNGTSTGGNREFVPYLSRAAAGVGVDSIFMEVHPNPDEALSDGPNMVKLSELEEVLKPVVEIDRLVKQASSIGGDHIVEHENLLTGLHK